MKYTKELGFDISDKQILITNKEWIDKFNDGKPCKIQGFHHSEDPADIINILEKCKNKNGA